MFILIGWVAACNAPQPASPTPTTSSTATSPPSTLTPHPTIHATPTATPPLPTIPATSPFQPDALEGWCWQEVLGLVNPLNDVFFWDAQTGWAVGENGTILHTADGGATWQWQDSPVDARLSRVVFVDAQTGWIAGWKGSGGGGKLLRTDDGGHTWIEHPIPSTNTCCSADITWADTYTGRLVLGNRIFHTTDSGRTWQEQSLPLESSMLEAITSVDSQHVWTIAWNTILRSTDGGVTWTAHTPTPNFYPEAFTFVDAQTGWAVSYSTIWHTTDGGQTWQVQYEDADTPSGMRAIDFIDAQTGWVVGGFGQIWHTTDGGATWETWEVPYDRQAIAFMDAQHGWAVGGWMDGKRTTIAHTNDGGMTWQIQDTHISMPPLGYMSSAHFTSYLTQQEPPLEILLARLFPGPCSSEEHGWMVKALLNLGWDGTAWGDSPATPESFRAIQRLDADLDQDGIDEVVLYSELGGFIGKFSQLFVGVLDWDGMYWQVAHFNRIPTSYSGSVRVRLDDINADGQPELLVEMLTFYTGSGWIGEIWDMTTIHCDHLSCRSILTETLGHIERGAGAGTLYYAWSGSNYYLIDFEQDAQPGIELQQYGLTLKQTWISSGTLTREVQILPISQTVFLWDGVQYTPTLEIELGPGYILDMHPVTETVDLDGDGRLEQAVYRWVSDYDGLWQTLSLYERDDQRTRQPTQVFTTAITGAPSAGLSLQDVDDDGQIEVVECATSFLLTYDLAEIEEWPSMQPDCTVYGWGYVTHTYKPRLDEEK